VRRQFGHDVVSDIQGFGQWPAVSGAAHGVTSSGFFAIKFANFSSSGGMFMMGWVKVTIS
jgi:hypothetical protein